MKQNGFTLIELLVAMGIGVVLLTAIVGSIFLVAYGSMDVRNEMVALADIENAAHWLTRDIVMGQVTNLVEGEEPVSTANMTWDDLTAEEGEEISHYVVYTHSGTELLRQYDSANNTIIVGRNLTYVGFSLDGSLVTVTLTASSDGMPRSTVTRTYVTQMRAKSEEVW